MKNSNVERNKLLSPLLCHYCTVVLFITTKHSFIFFSSEFYTFFPNEIFCNASCDTMAVKTSSHFDQTKRRERERDDDNNNKTRAKGTATYNCSLSLKVLPK